MFHSLNSTQDQYHQVISKLGNMPLAEGYEAEEVGEILEASYTRHGVLMRNGNVLLIPFEGPNFHEYIPASKKIDKLCSKPVPEEKYGVGVLLPDGNVLCPPYNGERCLLYETKTNTTRFVGEVIPNEYGENFLGACMTADRKVLLIPDRCSYCYLYDPISERTTRLDYKFNQMWNFAGGQPLPDDRVLMAPLFYPNNVVYHSIDNSFTLSIQKSGLATAAILPNGNCLLGYYDAARSSEVDVWNNRYIDVGPTNGARFKIYGCKQSPDGQIILIPNTNPTAELYNYRDKSSRNITEIKGGYSNGVTLSDGTILLIPKTATKLLLFKPRGVVPLPLQTCLSPYLNKF